MSKGLLVECRHPCRLSDDQIALLKGTLCYRIYARDFAERGECGLEVDNQYSPAPPILEQCIRLEILLKVDTKSC